MKSIASKQRGFSVVKALVIFLVVGLIALAGFLIWKGQQETPPAQKEQAVTSEQEMQQTDSELDATARDVDESLNTEGLETDIDAML